VPSQFFDVPRVTLNEAHSRVVLVLWRDFPDQREVELNQLEPHLSDLSPQELEHIADDLARLAIVRRKGNRIEKRERLVGTANG